MKFKRQHGLWVPTEGAKPLQLAHHSVTDWDYQHTDWILDVTQYVTPPSSFRISYKPGYPFATTLCKAPGTLVLPQGRIVDNIRFSWPPGGSPSISLRNQSPWGGANPDNHYWVHFTPLYAAVYTTCPDGEWIGPQTFSWDPPWSDETWRRVRVTWWVGYNTQNEKTFLVKVEFWHEGEWVHVGTASHTGNCWEDSDHNRCGYMDQPTGGYHNWHDWTQIWAPVPE